MERAVTAEGVIKYKLGVKDLFGRLSTKLLITPENIAYVAYPIVNYIFQERPDYILAFDRGARIFALATAVLYRELYGALPTIDHRINFRKVSRKVSQDDLRRQFKHDVERMLSVKESPTVLLLDEWVFTGETKNLAKKLISEFSNGRVNVLYGVMRGKGKGIDWKAEEVEISGDRYNFTISSWRNNIELIGVDYDTSLQPHIVRSPRTILFRERIISNVSNFAQRIKSG